MKYIVNKSNLISIIKIALMVLIAIIISCQFGDPNGDDNNDFQIILVKNLEAVKEYPNDAAELKQATIENDTLKLGVSYSGGCKTHNFKLIGLKQFAESNPVQATAYISHDANKDACESYITDELEFDLTPLRDHYKSLYQDDGPIRLAIHEPGEYSLSTLVMYEF